MTQWIGSDDGRLINLDHVVEACVIRPDKDGNNRMSLSLVGGGSANVTVESRMVFEDIIAAVYPAASGTEAVIVGGCTTSDQEPVMADVSVLRVPVIGWRKTNGFSHAIFIPVLPTDQDLGDRVAVLMPDGKYLTEDGSFVSLRDLKEMVLNSAQYQWRGERERAA